MKTGCILLVFVVACLISLIVFSFAEAQNFPHVKIGTVNYPTSYMTDPWKSIILSWQAKYTDFFVKGASPKNFSTNNIWVDYQTIIGMYSTPIDSSYNDLRNFSDANGYEFENVFMHMKQDFTARNPWSGMDKFDAFDKAAGVIVDNSGVLADKTTEGYNTAAGDVAFSSNLYIGYGMPYAEMNFILSRNSSNMAGRWEYWNGAGWSDLSQITDGTNNFTKNGKITFLPPSDWGRTSVSNSMRKYFLRYNVVSASTLPIISRIYGDSWMTGSRCRGWNSSDPGIINSGELAFNPNPPANATAKFRYQGRATGYWQTTYVFINPAYISNGKRVWAEFNAQRTVNSILANGFDGVMFDSLGDGMSAGISDPPTSQEYYSDFFDYTSNSWDTESLESYNYTINKIHQILPSAKVGGNTYRNNYVLLSDFTLREYASPPANGGALAIAAYSGTSMNYDNYLPQYNPNGKIVVFMQQDVLDHRSTQGGAFWDRSNRGPIAALSSHYIAMNDYTYLHYYSEGGWRYDETDEILVYDNRTAALTQDVPEDNSSATKYIYGTNFSAFPSSGSRRIAKLGDNVIISFSKVDNQTLSTTSGIYYPVPTGAIIKFVSQSTDRMSSHEASKDFPQVEDVYRWANYFPAEFVDIGQPDSSGWNGGKRGIWNATYGIYRRDFTNAIALHKMAYWNTNKIQFDTYTAPIDLNGTYYPLRADGRFDPTTSSIALRTGEGAILFKQANGSQCIHKSDNNPCDGCVQTGELTAFINRWQISNQDVNLRELIEAIGFWKRGCQN